MERASTPLVVCMCARGIGKIEQNPGVALHRAFISQGYREWNAIVLVGVLTENCQKDTSLDISSTMTEIVFSGCGDTCGAIKDQKDFQWHTLGLLLDGLVAPRQLVHEFIVGVQPPRCVTDDHFNAFFEGLHSQIRP